MRKAATTDTKGNGADMSESKTENVKNELHDDDELKNTIHGTSVEEQSKPVPFLKLISLAYPERYMLLFSLFLMIISEGLGLVPPLFIAGAYDALVDPSLSTSEKMSDVNRLMIYVLITHVVSMAAYGIRASIMGTAGVRIVARTRNQLYDCIMKQEIAFFDVTKSGELVSRLGSDTGLLEEGISTALPEVTIGGIVVIVAIGIMLWISWQLALMMIGFLFLISLLVVPFGSLMGHFSKAYQDLLGLAQTHSTEALGAIRTVQSFAAEEKELYRYTKVIGKPENYKWWWPTDHKKNKTTYSYGFYKSLATIGMFSIIFGLGFAALYIMLWYGFKLVNDGELTLGKLTAFQSYIFQIGATLGQTSTFLAKLIETQGAASRLFYLLERIPTIPTPAKEQPSSNNDDEQPATPKILTTIRGAVDFNNVSFAYPTRPNIHVLKNFTLSISPNQTVALVGASGSGKTTVISLLQRFYDVTASVAAADDDHDNWNRSRGDGSITLDGYDIRDLDIKWLRSQMSYVQQEPQLFGLTIRENIMYGITNRNDTEITQDEIEGAAKEANAHEFITKFPDGYETLVGERGIQLSGGQKQRIAIARALLPQPRILLLDEATSALDAESEHLVQEAIDNAVIGRTVVIVAHRLSTVQRANQIVVIDQNHIVDVGTHIELLNRCGKYQELIKRQALIGGTSSNIRP